MFPTDYLIQRIALAVADDASVLASAGDDAPKLMLCKGDFTPGRNLTFEDLTPATFTGSTPLQITAGNQQVVNNPTNAMPGILLKEPVGGFRWVCTADPEEAEVITGVALYYQDSQLLAAMRFDTPVTIAHAGDFVEISALLGYFANPPLQ